MSVEKTLASDPHQGPAEMRPLCFILMPFGRKNDLAGNEIDFDQVYATLIKPAVEAAGLEPIRADEERDGGIIHKPMFERLLLCPYAIGDLTLANANVFYELGVRHAVRPHSTLLLYSPEAQRLPFDVQPLRAIAYRLEGGLPASVSETQELIKQRLIEARDPVPDSPLVSLLEGYQPPPLDSLRSDAFRERARYAADVKRRLESARESGVHSIDKVRDSLGPLEDVEAGILVDLVLSYRDASEWGRVVGLVEGLPEALKRSVLVQEQYAFSLNRMGRRREAIRILESLIERLGPSSETLGILGRVYKDAWKEAKDTEDEYRSGGLLAKAIEVYRRGFEADWRDPYPGVNLVSLLAVQNPDNPEIENLVRVVKYSRDRRADETSDYWDYATALELAVIVKDGDAAQSALEHALAERSDSWQRETTADNLRMHIESRRDRSQATDWLEALETALRR